MPDSNRCPRHARTARSVALSWVWCAAIVAAGCSYVPELDELPLTHRIDIQQGNVVTQEMLAQLRPGMDKKQVRFIMGTPLIQDTFHANRWDYLYTFKEGRGRPERRLVTLVFAEDTLDHVEGDVQRAPGRLEVNTRQDKIVDVPKAKERGIFGKVRGVFSDDDPPDPTEAYDKVDQSTPEAVKEADTVADEDVDADEDTDGDAETVAEVDEDDAEAGDEAQEDERGVFGRFLDRFGLGDKSTTSDDRDDALIYRDPTNPDDVQP